MSRTKISLLLCTKNEEENISKNFDWLTSCKTINEIIVVDDDSTDNTVKLLEQLESKDIKVKIFNRGLDGNFSDQRNFGISKSTNDFVLWLDADETPSTKLIGFLNNIDTHQYDNVSFKRDDVFIGHKLKHGETANLKFVRLFNKKYGKFVGAVHEIWQSNKNITDKNLIINHYSHQTLKSFIQKINFYTDIRAKELFDQKTPVSLIHIILYPIGKFINNYFFKLGFLDSTAGIVMALSMSFHSFLVRAKLWHLYQK